MVMLPDPLGLKVVGLRFVDPNPLAVNLGLGISGECLLIDLFEQVFRQAVIALLGAAAVGWLVWRMLG